MKHSKRAISKKEHSTSQKKKFWTTRKIIIFLLVLLALFGAKLLFAKKKNVTSPFVKETDTVTRGDIEVTITGSSSVEPYERYEIIPKVNGDIVSCPFTVGDKVKKGDLLYQFDTSNNDLSIEKQRISLQQSENSYNSALEQADKLYIRAKTDGVISNLTVKEGNDIKAGTKIADITDRENLEVILPFTAAQIATMRLGEDAEITSSKHMSTVSGLVSHISSTGHASEDGTELYDVTISFTNPGVFYEGMTVGGAVGECVSPGSGVIESFSSSTVYSEAEGTIAELNYANGDYVEKDSIIAVLESDSIDDMITDSTLSFKNAKLSMEQTEKNLEDYKITSPISGTVITKNSKAGDTIDKTTASTVMMVVADVSRLKFKLSVDELDVSKVREGQKVMISCDALPKEKFTGKITTISVEGDTQNGVTTYSAEVVIDEPGNLRPSMNVDATIITESAKDVLILPTEDIKTFGGKSYVFVKGEKVDKYRDGGKASKDEKPKGFGNGERPSGSEMGERPDIPENGERPGFPENGERPSGSAGGEQPNERASNIPTAPEGYLPKEVKIGLSNEEYTEIVSGLREGQEVYHQSTVSSSGGGAFGGMGGMGGMGGGMGGRPSGGMGGGMGGRPSGGMGGGMR